MKKQYNKRNKKSTGKKDQEALETVTVELPLPIAEILAGVEVEIEELAGRAGMLIIEYAMASEVDRRAGRRYAHMLDRENFRWGTQKGSIVYAGRKVEIDRPRVRSASGQEVPLATYQAFSQGEKMQEAVYDKLILGVSSRNYERAIDDFMDGYGVKKSSVSRNFVKVTKVKLEELMERDLSGLDLCAIMIDGIGFKGNLLVVSIGIDTDGKKHVLGLWQGATENAEVVTSLLEDLGRRGLDTNKRYLFILDGAKALSKAVKKMFGEDVAIQRCHLHKRRNVKGHLPEKYHTEVDKRIRNAYKMTSYEDAKASLKTTISYLERLNPSAARSLEEGLEETLTLHRLGIPDALRKNLSSTNIIESCFSTTRFITGRVKRWRGGDQVQRWAASALLEAEKRFNRIDGYRMIPTLISALNPVRQSVDVKEAVA